jgi:peptidoglycan hydrolase-like protein with peptidoglycan-binding domain
MLGYNAGQADGINGPKTEHAVLNFQADNNPLKADGLCGPRTQRGLRDAVGE